MDQSIRESQTNEESDAELYENQNMDGDVAESPRSRQKPYADASQAEIRSERSKLLGRGSVWPSQDMKGCLRADDDSWQRSPVNGKKLPSTPGR